ncbi:MAG: cell division protein ZipA [Pseudomonadales bacterium]
MELGIREWMIVIGVLLLVAVLLDGIRKMRAERRNHIRVAFKMGGGVYDEDSYVDPVDREVSKPRVVESSEQAVQAVGTASGTVSSNKASKAKVSPRAKKVAESKTRQATAEGQERHSKTDAARIEPSIGEAVDMDLLESAWSANDEATAKRATVTKAISKPAKPGKIKASDESVTSFRSSRAPKPKVEYFDEFLAVYVLAKNDAGFNGADLLQILLACDLRFGKRSIFHRHEYKNGTGPVQFSMANISEPGTFDLNTIESFQTPGICFFISMPGPEDPLKAFDYMVETAKCVARNLDGELKDEARSAMTAQTLEHYRARVQEFERRQLTMSV